MFTRGLFSQLSSQRNQQKHYKLSLSQKALTSFITSHIISYHRSYADSFSCLLAFFSTSAGGPLLADALPLVAGVCLQLALSMK